MKEAKRLCRGHGEDKAATRLEAGRYSALSAGVCFEPKFVIDGIENNGRCP